MDPMIITLILLAFAIVMFVLEKIPLALTSMIVCIALVVTGVLSIEEAFEGFIDTNVILFVAMFIVGGALFETGMANKLGGIVTKFAKTRETADRYDHGRGRCDVRIPVKHRDRSRVDTGSDRNRRKVRLFPVEAADAARICGGHGWQYFPHRSARQSDCTGGAAGHRTELRVL